MNMVVEESGIDEPNIGAASTGCCGNNGINGNGSKSSDEKLALVEFAYRLSSCHYTLTTTTESGTIIADDDDEGSTRQEAELLMSLLACPIRNVSDSLLDPVSASESEASSSSSSTSSSYARRDSFSFTCPSLSLENSDHLPSSALRFSRRQPHLQGEPAAPNPNVATLINEAPVPAQLLGRPLKVDDRDALRLSADAMARNIHQSFHKALQWRIQAWINTLSKSLVEKEMHMKRNGVPADDLRKLLDTREARLILHLREVANAVQVISTTTKFQVLGMCPSKNGELKDDSPDEAAAGEGPAAKKQRLLELPQEQLCEEGEYQYKVAHVLMMECAICMKTPAGYADVNLEVPGSIEGTFLSTETGMEELKSIVLELETSILAAMVEKSCRTVVRASVEAIAKAAAQEIQPQEQHQVEASTTAEAAAIAQHKPAVEGAHLVDIKTPAPSQSGPFITAKDVRAAMVTPKTNLPPRKASHSNHDSSSPKPILLPIPDHLDDHHHRVKGKNTKTAHHAASKSLPRRISPQPHVPSHSELDGSSNFTRRHTLPRHSPITTSTSSPRRQHTQKQKQLPNLTQRKRARPPLVSPSLNESSVEYVHGQGPSLPMLVEAACHVMHSDA